MEPMNTSVILALLYTSVACAIELQSPKTTGRNSKAKERQNLSKGTKCGIPTTAPKEGRVIGGVEANPHSWPWQVLIGCKLNKTHSKTCGGNIISDKWIITAAHCLALDNIDIRSSCELGLGKHDFKRIETTQLRTKMSYYNIHEKYDRQYALNDVALIKLAIPLKFTDAIKPICLPFGLPELPYNKSCIATGWGVTRFGSELEPGKLMQLPMTVLEVLYCSIAGVLCATSGDQNKDVCFGDSGGPLACKESDQKWYLRGVASMVNQNCTLMGYFTEVSHLEAWIKDITSRN